MSRRAKLLAFTLAMLGLLGVATAAQAETQLFSGSLIIEGFGRDEGYNRSYPTPYFSAIPLGAHCNPYAPKGLGTFCGTVTTIQQGAPLTGTGNAATDGMGGFTLPLSGLARKTSGSLRSYPPYLLSYTYADLKNQKGTFFAGGGPGSFSFPYTVDGAKVAKAAAQKGSNQFGGTMQLLGTYQSRGVFSQYTGLSYQYSFDWGIDILGASSMGTGTGMYYNTVLMQTGTVSGKNTAFPWTTGTVTATASRRPIAGYPPNTMKRKGYDNRVPTGQGTIQLVTPLLTHWINPTFNDNDSAAIGILLIKFGLDGDGDGVVDANDDCPDSNPEPEPTVVIEGCNSGVSNTQLARGCTISERIQQCDDDAKNHGAFRRCVSMLGDSLQQEGVLTGPEKDRILSCSGQKRRRPRQRSGILSWIFPSVR
jgi:hypothetical protein